MMMDFEAYLTEILPAFGWYKGEKQLYCIAGYDAADTLLEGLRDTVFPVVLVEDLPDGNLSFEDGFLDNRVISFWVMEKVPVADDAKRKAALRRCHSGGMEIIRRMVNDYGISELATAFDRSRVPYFPRGPIAQQCWGYEFMLTFRMDVDLSL